MNLTDLLSGSVISSIAGQTGTSEKDTQNVLANALPALVGAMAQNASTEDGANSLARALDDHTSSKGLASLLQNVDTEDGTKILTKILGGETETVRNAVAKKSGAIPFALELVRQLAGEAEADRIRSAIAYRH